MESSNGAEYEKYVYNITLKTGIYYFQVSNLKLTNTGSKKVRISYKSAKRTMKYEIYRKTKGGGWKK